MLSIAELVSLIGIVMLGVGLAVTWIRNGRSQGSAMGTLSTEIKNIHKRLDDPDTGLGSIKKAVDGQALHCAKVSTGLANKVEALEKKRRK